MIILFVMIINVPVNIFSYVEMGLPGMNKY